MVLGYSDLDRARQARQTALHTGTLFRDEKGRSVVAEHIDLRGFVEALVRIITALAVAR